VAGISLLEFKRSIDMRNKLNICNLNEDVGKQKENWCEHILRMDENVLLKILSNYEPERHKDIVRCKARWKDKFN
jgi:hypothetical protein